MNLYFDLRTRNLVTTPGLDDTLDALTFKAGDGEEIVLQFGRSPDGATPLSVTSAPSWTAESLPSGALITIGIKESGDYSDGTLLAGTSTYVEDTDAKTYTFTLDLNTTEIDTLLQRGDADDTDDVAAIENALFEVTFKTGASAKPRTSVNDVLTTIKHDVLYGDEGTPSNAGDPDEYALIANTIQYFPTVTGLTGGTSTDLDNIATVDRDVGESVYVQISDVQYVYRLSSGTDAESSPDVIRPDDYNVTTNQKVWKRQSTASATAATTAFTAAGNIASVNVQDAIEELDSEKAASSHSHAASDITSGTVATARLGSGTADSTTFLRGDQTWATPAGTALANTDITGQTEMTTGAIDDYIAVTDTSASNVLRKAAFITVVRGAAGAKKSFPLPLSEFVATSGTPVYGTDSETGGKSWAFDASSTESIRGHIVLPGDYSNTLKIKLFWWSGSTGDVVWEVDDAAGAADGEAIAPASATSGVTDSVTGANLLNVTTAITLGGGSPYDILPIVIQRDGGDGSDTLAADAYLVAAICEYSWTAVTAW